jgi:predicted transcriptional regulator
MSIEIKVHPVQATILRVLLFNTEAKFSELNTQQMSTDHFNFHVKKLLELGLIEKQKNLYNLTTKGKEFANRFDTDDNTIERQAKVSVLVAAIKMEGGKKKYLVQQRLKQPFYGDWGRVGGKVRWGETIYETAVRELKEETGLNGEVRLTGVFHKMDYNEDGLLLEDKFFYSFCATKTHGSLRMAA